MTCPGTDLRGPSGDLAPTFDALGYRFALRSDIEGTREAAEHLFAPWRREEGTKGGTLYELLAHGTGGLSELLAEGRSIQRASGPGSMMTWVIADVGRGALTGAPEHATVHAGVVSRGDVAVMLPAPPDHGKTTTVVGLVRAGFAFLSDESAPIGIEDGLVHPFPRPLMLSPDSMRLFPELRASLPAWHHTFRSLNHLVSPMDLRHDCLGKTGPVRYIVAPSYAKGAETRLEPASRAEMLTLLLEQTFNLRTLGTAAVERLATTVREAECYRLTIGDLDAAVRAIERLTEGGTT